MRLYGGSNLLHYCTQHSPHSFFRLYNSSCDRKTLVHFLVYVEPMEFCPSKSFPSGLSYCVSWSRLCCPGLYYINHLVCFAIYGRYRSVLHKRTFLMPVRYDFAGMRLSVVENNLKGKPHPNTDQSAKRVCSNIAQQRRHVVYLTLSTWTCIPGRHKTLYTGKGCELICIALLHCTEAIKAMDLSWADLLSSLV